MSVKVVRHGNTFDVTNPMDGTVTRMINVILVEEGRGGADKNMSETSKLLSDFLGQDVGLGQMRTHTHPVRADKIGSLPVDTVLPFFINRGMYSTPQINQQVGKQARIVDGRPTYFKTWLGDKPEEDEDHRLSNEVLLQTKPEAFFDAAIGAAKVTIIERRENPFGSQAGRQQQPVGEENGGNHANADVLGGAQPGNQGGQG